MHAHNNADPTAFTGIMHSTSDACCTAHITLQRRPNERPHCYMWAAGGRWEGCWEALCGPMSFLTPVCNLALLRQEEAASGFWMLYHKLSAVLLNTLAAIAGSSATFGFVCALIVSWAIAGIFVHDNDIWQISMQVAIAVLRCTACSTTCEIAWLHRELKLSDFSDSFKSCTSLLFSLVCRSVTVA